MEIIGFIRQGDKTACGGTVIEGDPRFISYGRPCTFQGALVACRKNCVIIEGTPLVTVDGRARVVHGMVTSNGCPCISTLNGIDGIGNDSGEAIATGYYQSANEGWLPKFGPEHFTKDSPDEQIRAINAKTGEPIPDLAYYIKAPDGTIYTGRTNSQGLCERVTTYHPEELTVWFGLAAEQKGSEA
jgi:uncharacterized Zn-binding protein involved in type VI secretion